jgi:hypothetical protein
MLMFQLCALKPYGMLNRYLYFFFLTVVSVSWADKPTAIPDAHYKLIIPKHQFVQAKNYYLLTLFEEQKDVKSLLEKDTALVRVAQNKIAAISQSLKDCNNEALCFSEKMKFTDEEIKTVGERLTALYHDGNPLDKLVKLHLIPSGTYVLFSNLSPKEMLVKAWEQDANGINFVIGVYAEGKKANYPNIDSISFNVNDKRYGGFVYTAAYEVMSETKNAKLFFTPSLASALLFLQINDRERAGDYEPMNETVNKAAFERIKTIKWDNYKYSLILVPGAGPEEREVELSAEGMLRLRLAALQYQQGVAPFIVVSGGKVHPYKTKYCEAEEMKKFLMDKMDIPEYAIIMEPHARHTTTNLRNCVRLIFRYGIPFHKVCLTCSSRGQSMMIANTLADRCKKELQEIPFRVGNRLSETEVEFYPVIDALHINPTEPMDP